MYGSKSNADSSVFIDPEEFFKQQFGGGKFQSLIGEISIAKDFKEAMTKMSMEDPNASNPMASEISMEERIEAREARVAKLASTLVEKLSLYTDAFPIPPEPEHHPPPSSTSTSTDTTTTSSTTTFTSVFPSFAAPLFGSTATNPQPRPPTPPIGTTFDQLSSEALESFRTIVTMEAENLRKESYGVELLHAIGFTYTLKSQQYAAKLDSEDDSGNVLKKAWGMGSHFVGVMREKAHIVGETVGTFKTALDLQSSFSKLQDLEKKKEAAVASSSGASGAGNGGVGGASTSSASTDQNGAKRPDATSTIDEDSATLTPEERELRMKLEREAATKGLEALWRGSKLEVEAVLREGE
jgi:hypothetical protein